MKREREHEMNKNGREKRIEWKNSPKRRPSTVTENDTLEMVSQHRIQHLFLRSSSVMFIVLLEASRTREKIYCEAVYTMSSDSYTRQTHIHAQLYSEQWLNSHGETFDAHTASAKVSTARTKKSIRAQIVSKTSSPIEMQREKSIAIFPHHENFSFGLIAFIFGHSSCARCHFLLFWISSWESSLRFVFHFFAFSFSP